MSDQLSAGAELALGDKLTSPNGLFELVLRSDGDLVLRHLSTPVVLPNNSSRGLPAGDDAAYWSSGTWALPEPQRPSRALMRDDGNLVLLDKGGAIRWASGTFGDGLHGAYLALENDGNLVVRHGEGLPIWATGRPGGAGNIPAAGRLRAADDLSASLDRLGRLPPVITGSSDLAPPQSSTVDASGVAYIVTEQRRRLVNEIVEQSFLQDLAAMGVWPGQVIQGRALLAGDVAQIGPLSRVPGTVTVVTDLIADVAGAGQSREVASPSVSTVNEARRSVITQVNPTDSPGIVKFGVEKASTLREVGVKLGLTVKGTSFGVDANASLTQTYKQSVAVAVIRQIFYSVTFTPSGPQAAGFWDESVKFQDIAPYVGPDNPPLFIDSVQYGRLICLTAQGSYSSADLTAALRANVQNATSVTGSADVRTQQIMENSEVKAYTIGVPGRQTFQTLADPIDDLRQVFKNGLMFNSQNLGAPISFTARHVADGTLARVALAAEYVQPLAAQGADITGMHFHPYDGPGGGLVNTGINVNPGDTVTVSTNGEIWSGVFAAGLHGPEGWPGHHADQAAPKPDGTAYALLVSFGGTAGSWIEAGRFWQGTPPNGRPGRLLLNINDNNPYNGNDWRKFDSTVDVHRGDAGSAGVFI
ncbi:thiol-activated cytolysin family protein [Sphaerisporangium aureirubrum]|uniref:Thiol-activated cytolysin family protein n=1 Tax=Sphaerisporangium aureirubrum TaxID=1544736 RepID=A0ABW1NFW2_9ACTN